MAAPRQSTPLPVFRKLRVFAVDPGMTARFETARHERDDSCASRGSRSSRDRSASTSTSSTRTTERSRLHPPVDLDRTELLAQDGLPPSDGNPQFRQQMVYAVTMRTIRNFERALGRSSTGRRGRRTDATGAGCSSIRTTR